MQRKSKARSSSSSSTTSRNGHDTDNDEDAIDVYRGSREGTLATKHADIIATMNDATPSTTPTNAAVGNAMTNETTNTTTVVLSASVKRNKCGTRPFDHHWLNLDCCGLSCACITYMLHVYGMYAFAFVLLPPWMSNTDEDGYRELTMACHVHRLLFVSVSMLAIFSHYRAMTTRSRIGTADAYPLHDDREGDGGLITSLIKGERTTATMTTTTTVRDNDDIMGVGSTNTTTALTRSAAIAAGGSVAAVAAVAAAGMTTVGAMRRTTSSTSSSSSSLGGGGAALRRRSRRTMRESATEEGEEEAVDRYRPRMSMNGGKGNSNSNTSLGDTRSNRGISSKSSSAGEGCADDVSRSSHRGRIIADLLPLVGLAVEALLFGLFTLCMMADQWDVVMTNLTHIDRLKGETSMGRRHGGSQQYQHAGAYGQLPKYYDQHVGSQMSIMRAGINEVFGTLSSSMTSTALPRSKFHYTWLSPVHRVCFPEGVRDDILGYCRPCGSASTAGGLTAQEARKRSDFDPAEIL
ncbi:hypothetical protein ACHAXA_005260 [Cyclostephanos tholiformis]|uniref:Transmembrane protein n=1 Tax=Cyclostephanos tholiformis TaxID=382380 RepID=A0ABD3RJF4_9STRA